MARRSRRCGPPPWTRAIDWRPSRPESLGGDAAEERFSRPLPVARTVRFSATLLGRQPAGSPGALLLAPRPAARLGRRGASRGAAPARLHLSAVSLPPDARIWVYGEAPGEEVSVTGE